MKNKILLITLTFVLSCSLSLSGSEFRSALSPKSSVNDEWTPQKWAEQSQLLMGLLGISDVSRYLQTNLTSINPLVFIETLKNKYEKIKNTDVPIETILKELEKISYFEPIAANYRYQIEKQKLSNQSFSQSSLDLSVNFSPSDGSVSFKITDPGEKTKDSVLDLLLKVLQKSVSAKVYPFRDKMIDFIGRFMDKPSDSYKKADPDLQDIVEKISSEFLKGIDLKSIKYVVTSGIGANEMYSKQLASLINSYFKKSNVDFEWIVVNNPADVEKFGPEKKYSGANADNTLVFEMSRSGTTAETLGFFKATKDRFPKRIVAANPGDEASLHSLASKFSEENPQAKILLLDNTPGTIGGRLMNYKTLMVYAPLFLALSVGNKDTKKAKDALNIYTKALFEANQSLDYTKENSPAVKAAEFLFKLRESGGDKWALIYDPALLGLANEHKQLVNEGNNKIGGPGTNFNILELYSTDQWEDYLVVADGNPKVQLPIFFLDSRSKNYPENKKKVEALKAKGIPVFVLTANGGSSLAAQLKVQAYLSAFSEDLAIYFSHITSQDANANPAVKMVREFTPVIEKLIKNLKNENKPIITASNEIFTAVNNAQEAMKQKAEQNIAEKFNTLKLPDTSSFTLVTAVLSELANSLQINVTEVTKVMLSSINAATFKTDVGESVGASNATVNAAFARTAFGETLGSNIPKIEQKALTQEIQLIPQEGEKTFSVSIALEEGQLFPFFPTEESLAQNLANYMLKMYLEKDLTYIPVNYPESFLGSDNPFLEIQKTINKELGHLSLHPEGKREITALDVPLPKLAHSGIEAIMTHLERVLNISIILTKANGDFGNKNKVGDATDALTINEMSYALMTANVDRMTKGGAPGIKCIIEDQTQIIEAI